MPDNQLYPNFLTDDFKQACCDYFYLVDRHFPEKGVLKLVGDRYRLSGDQRTVLYRGIASRYRSDLRKRLITENISGNRIFIDGYNVLFTLINYRFGKITFISTDCILRDAGSLHGKLKDYSTLSSCMEMLVTHLRDTKPSEVEIFLDSPVSHSNKHADMLNEMLALKSVAGKCTVLNSADWALRHATGCTLATSDTGIIEKALLPVADLPRQILIKEYHAVFLNLIELLGT